MIFCDKSCVKIGSPDDVITLLSEYRNITMAMSEIVPTQLLEDNFKKALLDNTETEWFDLSELFEDEETDKQADLIDRLNNQ